MQYGVNKNTPLHPISTLPKPAPIITTYFFKKNFATASKMLVRKPEGKRPLGLSMRRWKDNIKVDLKEIGREGIH